ncbi:MAG TPA: S9 family peptidase [Caulobacteraceae bacterium]|jgi:acylaminoacyl-peptidase
MTVSLRRLFLATAAAGALSAFALSAAQAAPHGLTAKEMLSLDRLSGLKVSPDGHWALYDVRSTDWDANKGVHALWIVDTDGKTAPRRLGVSDKGVSDAQWSADGKTIYFLAPGADTTQVWRTTPDGTGATQVTYLPLDVGAYRVAADGKHLVVSLAVVRHSQARSDCRSEIECTAKPKPQGTQASGKIYTRLFVRHWDQWDDGTDNHLFSIEIGADGIASAQPVELMAAFDGDVPSKPFGDEGDFAISPSGSEVTFSAKVAGTTAAWSTNFDLFRVPMDGSSAPVNLTASNHAEDVGPVYSPDGAMLAYKAMKRATFEADRLGVMVMDVKTGAVREVDPGFDRSAENLVWSADGKTIYANAEDVGQDRIFAIDVKSGAVKPLTGDGRVTDFAVTKKGLVFARDDYSHPMEIFTQGWSGAPAQITHTDAAALADVKMGDYETFTFSGWNGETVHGYLVKPWNYEPGKKYPVAFLIHGGPQGSFGSNFGYRWNPQTYAGAGYAVVMIDFHGSTGYGQAFTDAISQHWGDRPLEDLQKGWAAALAKYSFLDGDHACALGASYGGYMIDWIAGAWSQPWKCLVVHDGVFDNRMMGYSTEELWFSEWENGGTVWSNPAGYEKFNPALHVGDWNKPMLVVHSARDYRIPLEQGLAAFSALQRKGVPSELLTFPDENHWVLKPKNSLEWHDTVLDWLDRWTKPGA